MDNGNKLGVGPFKSIGYLLRFDDATPGGLDFDDLGPAPFCDVDHACSEHAVDADNDFVAGLEQIDEAKLHAGTLGSADRKGHLVLRQKDLPEHLFEFLHHLDEKRIEVADQRL